MQVTLLIPTLNEVEGMKVIMPRIKKEWYDQLIILDGGSTDGTIEYARQQGYFVYIQKKKGFRNAYNEVLPFIKGDVVLTFSPDGNSIPELIPELTAKMKEGYDMVIASRYFGKAKSQDDDLVTAFGNRLFTKTVNFLHDSNYTDAMVIFRAYRTQLIYDLELHKDEGYAMAERLFNTNISWEPLLSVRAAKRKLKIAEIPGDEPTRIGGERKLRIFKWGAAYYFQFIREKFRWDKTGQIRKSSNMHKNNIVFYIFAVVIIVTAFCLYRSPVGFVWDDSPRLMANKYDVSNPILWGQNGLLGRILKDSFAEISSSGYRPLSTFIKYAGVSIFCNPNASPYLWFFFVGIILGLLCVSLYLVSRRYLKTKAGAVLAVLLFAFSVPVITGSWVVFVGIQSIVPLLICAGLLLYWKVFESEKYKYLYFVILCLLLFVGPWFREFVGFLPLLLIFLEIRRVHRPTILTVLLSIFFLHSLFPTFLPKIIFFKDLPLKSIFSLGSLAEQISSIDQHGALFFVKRLLLSIRWQMPQHFLTLLPPIIIGLILVDYISFSFVTCYKIASQKAGIVKYSDSKIERMDLTLAFINFLLFICFVIFVLAIKKDYYNITFCSIICLVFFLQGLRVDSFLSVWFLLFFVPFLWVFTEQVHLAYALLPSSIIMAKTIESISLKMNVYEKRTAVLRYLFFFLILFELADQSLNLYGSYKVVSGISHGIRTISASIKQRLPKNSIVITNALHMDDTRLYNNDWVKIFYTVQAGIARHEDGNTIDPAILEKVLQNNLNKRDIYFISVDFDYTPDKVNYHSHKYVRNRSVPMDDMGVINITHASYPYLDPFKAYITRPFISFLGPPDLENDFYRGPTQNKMPFLREVYCEYHLYKVVGTQMSANETDH